MALKKQAKILSKKEISQALDQIKKHRYPIRDKVLFLLSFKAGLRAIEISNLRWTMVTDASGNISNEIHLPDNVCKGGIGGIIHLNSELKEALEEHYQSVKPLNLDLHVVKSEKGSNLMPCNISHWFRMLYKSLRLEGCSSHSGRRYFITHTARNISKFGGSIRDVQKLARHKYLVSTQDYIENDVDAMRQVVQCV